MELLKPLILSLLPIVVILVVFFIPLYLSIKDAVKMQGSEKIAWLALILLVIPIGSIIYLVVDPRRKK